MKNNHKINLDDLELDNSDIQQEEYQDFTNEYSEEVKARMEQDNQRYNEFEQQAEDNMKQENPNYEYDEEQNFQNFQEKMKQEEPNWRFYDESQQKEPNEDFKFDNFNNNNDDNTINMNDKEEEVRRTKTTDFNAFDYDGEEQINPEEATKNKIDIEQEKKEAYLKFLSISDDRLAKRFSGYFIKGTRNARELKSCYGNQKAMSENLGNTQYAQNSIEKCFDKFLEKTKKNIEEGKKEYEKALSELALMPPMLIFVCALYMLKTAYNEALKMGMEIDKWKQQKELEHFLSLDLEGRKKYIDTLIRDLKGHGEQHYHSMNDFKKAEQQELNEQTDNIVKDFTKDECQNLNEAMEKDYFNQDISEERKNEYQQEFDNPDYVDNMKKHESEIANEEKRVEINNTNRYMNAYRHKEDVQYNTEMSELETLEYEAKNTLKEKNDFNNKILTDIGFDEKTRAEFDVYLKEKENFLNNKKFEYTINSNSTLYQDVSKNYESSLREYLNAQNGNELKEQFVRLDLAINKLNDEYVMSNKLYTSKELSDKLKTQFADIDYISNDSFAEKTAKNIITKQAQIGGENKQKYDYAIELNKTLAKSEQTLDEHKELYASLKEKENIFKNEMVKDNKTALNYELGDTLSKFILDKHNRKNIEIAGDFARDYINGISSKENIDKASKQIMKKITDNIVFENDNEKAQFEQFFSRPLEHFHTRALKHGTFNFIKLESQINDVFNLHNDKMPTINNKKNEVVKMFMNAINDELTSNNEYILKERQNIKNAIDTIKADEMFKQHLKYANNTTELKKLDQDILKLEKYFDNKKDHLMNITNRSFAQKTYDSVNKELDNLIPEDLRKNFKSETFVKNLQDEMNNYVNDVMKTPHAHAKQSQKENSYYDAIAKSILKTCNIDIKNQESEKLTQNIMEKIKTSDNLKYDKLSSTDLFANDKMFKNARTLNQLKHLRNTCNKNENTYKITFDKLNEGNSEFLQKIVDIAQNPTAGLTKSAWAFMSKMITEVNDKIKNGRYDPSFENNEMSDLKNKVMSKIALSFAVNRKGNNFINELRADTLSDNYIRDFKQQNSHLSYKKGRTQLKSLDTKELIKTSIQMLMNRQTDNIYSVVVANIGNKKNFAIGVKQFSRVLNGDKKNMLGMIKNSGGLEKSDLAAKYGKGLGSMAHLLIENLLVVQKDLQKRSNFCKNKHFTTIKEFEEITHFFNHLKENRNNYVFSKYANFGKAEMLTKFASRGIAKAGQKGLEKTLDLSEIMQQALKKGGIKGVATSIALKTLRQSAEGVFKATKEGKGATINTQIFLKSNPKTAIISMAIEKGIKDLKQTIEKTIQNFTTQSGQEDMFSQFHKAYKTFTSEEQENKQDGIKTKKTTEIATKVAKTIITRKP